MKRSSECAGFHPTEDYPNKAVSFWHRIIENSPRQNFTTHNVRLLCPIRTLGEDFQSMEWKIDNYTNNPIASNTKE